MSDDVNYVSDYFYREKQGQIGSARRAGSADRSVASSECRAQTGELERDYQRMRDDCSGDSRRH